MFFDDLSLIPKIAMDHGFSIFVLPTEIIDNTHIGKKPIKTASGLSFPPTTFYLEPDEKHSLKVDDIRTLEAEMTTKQLKPRFFVIKHAETLNEYAENAALKLLEEPRENCHLVFLTTSITNFLPTILSRASIFIKKLKDPLGSPVAADTKILENARALLAASPSETLRLVNSWTDKNHKKTRLEILNILSATIEIAYKSYFRTGNLLFLRKVPALINTYENIKGNGHIKLQLTANLC